jgi:D-glycero-alpha-D-manno-heptose-7-phosphate kinase
MTANSKPLDGSLNPRFRSNYERRGIVRARAPLRLGLAGGGTDVSPFCDEHGGFVLNASIDKYAYATIELRVDDKVALVAADQPASWVGDTRSQLEPIGDKLALLRGVYRRMVRDFNGGEPIPLTLTTHADAPPGSGLGSSSTLVVAIVKAFVELLNLPLGDYEIAHLAYEIERLDLGLAGGKQDQYAATFGGFNFIEFYANDRVLVNPLRVKNWIISELESSLVLFYTGVSRSSAAIIEEQTRNLKAGDQRSIDAMLALKEDAVLMKEGLLRGDFGTIAKSMELSWEAKKRTSHNISNSAIDEIYDAAKRAGAVAGKVSGAGGGGFMMFLVDSTKRMDVIRVLQRHAGQVLNCHFTHYGTQGWRLK